MNKLDCKLFKQSKQGKVKVSYLYLLKVRHVYLLKSHFQITSIIFYVNFSSCGCHVFVREASSFIPNGFSSILVR